jgi:transcriptional regulator with XRE-family HTH domain
LLPTGYNGRREGRGDEGTMMIMGADDRPVTKSVGDWLTAELRRRGWTQADLARRTGLSRGTISKYLRPPDHPHHRAPDFASLARIADALGVPSLDAVAAATGTDRTATPLQEECAALVLRIPDDVLATVLHQLRPLTDPLIQQTIREMAVSRTEAASSEATSPPQSL